MYSIYGADEEEEEGGGGGEENELKLYGIRSI